MNGIGGFVARVQRFLFWDAVRPVELFSAFNFLAWAHVLMEQPELLLRDSYAGFYHLGAQAWSILLLCIALGQFVPAAVAFKHAATLRFIAMSCASGAWFMIAISFISSDVSTTAEANYLLLSFICMASGAWLGWTSRSS